MTGSDQAGLSAEAIGAMTELRAPPLCPEIALHLVPAGETFEAFRTRHETVLGPAPPYWAVAWPGGQALARYLLDTPEAVAGRRVLDYGTGGGLAAIAAARAGARTVTAIDRDPAALAAARRNACVNGVSIRVERADLRAGTEGSEEDSAFMADVVLAGDLWYEAFDAKRASGVLGDYARAGATVLAGDPERSHFPRRRAVVLKSYTVPVSAALERADKVTAHVYRFGA